MTTFYLIRHARTNSNNHGRYMGWIDEGIDPAGAPGTEAVADRLSRVDLTAIYSSPLSRAIQTAEPLARRCQMKVTKRNEFGEMRMGAWEGMAQAEIAEAFPGEWKMWREDPAALRLPGRETLDEVQARVAAGLEDVVSSAPDATVAVFSHDVIVRTAILYVLGCSAGWYRRIVSDNCAISVLRYGAGSREVVTVNDTAHLQAAIVGR